jgi:hypothetical protein
MKAHRHEADQRVALLHVTSNASAGRPTCRARRLASSTTVIPSSTSGGPVGSVVPGPPGSPSATKRPRRRELCLRQPVTERPPQPPGTTKSPGPVPAANLPDLPNQHVSHVAGPHRRHGAVIRQWRASLRRAWRLSLEEQRDVGQQQHRQCAAVRQYPRWGAHGSARIQHRVGKRREPTGNNGHSALGQQLCQQARDYLSLQTAC